MRWTNQQLNQPLFPSPDDAGPAPLLPLAGLVQSVQTPEFAGITFHEVLSKSALNKVPPSSTMPFEWTVNPYRGCSHACVYCFARKSHTYLNFDSGVDFDSQVVVKVNVAQVLRRELNKPSWGHDHVALGTNTDPYHCQTHVLHWLHEQRHYSVPSLQGPKGTRAGPRQLPVSRMRGTGHRCPGLAGFNGNGPRCGWASNGDHRHSW